MYHNREPVAIPCTLTTSCAVITVRKGHSGATSATVDLRLQYGPEKRMINIIQAVYVVG